MGKEKLTLPDGSVYEGDFVNGELHGKGKKTYPDGMVYEGDWVNGKQNGKGKLITANSTYEGDFVDGYMTGRGKMIFASGDVYEGQVVSGKPDGIGKYTWADGYTKEGSFRDGNFVESGYSSSYSSVEIEDSSSYSSSVPVTTLSNENKKLKHRKSIGHEAQTNRWGYFFVAPFVVVFCVFNLWPTLYTFILSFTNLEGLRTDFKFNGFVNYIKLVKDPFFWGSMGNTFIIWTFNFIPQLGLALILSIWLSDIRLNLTGKGLFRAVVYMPNLLTAVSVALLFRSIFGYAGHVNAPANQFLRSLGFTSVVDGNITPIAIDFFRSVAFSRGLVAFIQWWMWYGYTMIILMAGITTIPISLYESASIDGANSRQTTLYITLPLLRPIMLYILVTSMIGGMQMFDIPFLLTDMMGAPNYKIRTTTMYQYNIALGRGPQNYAYGAAISVGIFIITIILALIIFFFLQDRSEIKKKKGGVV
jgi:multiple sugar transport system permease protein